MSGCAVPDMGPVEACQPAAGPMYQFVPLQATTSTCLLTLQLGEFYDPIHILLEAYNFAYSHLAGV